MAHIVVDHHSNNPSYVGKQFEFWNHASSSDILKGHIYKSTAASITILSKPKRLIQDFFPEFKELFIVNMNPSIIAFQFNGETKRTLLLYCYFKLQSKVQGYFSFIEELDCSWE